MKNARRIVVEDWVYDPKNYDPKERLMKLEKKLYLNSYIPSELVPEPGDTSLWDKLLDHYFNDNTKYKEHTQRSRGTTDFFSFGDKKKFSLG